MSIRGSRARLGGEGGDHGGRGDCACDRSSGDGGTIDWRAVKRRNALPLGCLLALILIAAVAAGCGGGSSGDTTSTAALTRCNIDGKQQNLGASYVLTIEVATVSCPQAEKVIVAYHACRQRNGGAGGTCKSPVLGFTCTEGSRQAVPGVQYNATVDCRKGESEIKSDYTQNF